MKPRITFTGNATPFILEALGKSIDKNGFVIDAMTKDFILDADGKKFKSNEMIGVHKNKFITNVFQLW